MVFSSGNPGALRPLWRAKAEALAQDRKHMLELALLVPPPGAPGYLAVRRPELQIGMAARAKHRTRLVAC